MQTIGFIGLGVLGSAIVKNIVDGGVQVVGYDIAEDARQNALSLGVTLTDNPAQVATLTDYVFTCLPNADALAEVTNGEDGLFSVEKKDLKKDQCIIEMSTLSLDDKTAFAERAEQAGCRPVDCPVSGNRVMALNKKLTAFFSGEESDYSLLKPVLELTCGKTHYVGDFGNGSKVKICGNILNLVHNTVAAETMVLAIKSGLDPAMFHEVISGSASSSAMFEGRGALMVDENYTAEGMNMSVPLKDSAIISQHASSLRCPLPLYQTALQQYFAAAAQGLDDKDASVVCKVMENNAAAERKAVDRNSAARKDR